MKTVFSKKGPTHWAEIPSPEHEKSGFKNSHWEAAIVGLAESGGARFITILRDHIQAGVIRSDRAKSAALTEPADA